MTVVRSFEDAQPPARFDDVPFTEARVQEAPDVDGLPGAWVTVETFALVPTDTDPSQPLPRDFTTAAATLDPAWYRIVWADADAATSSGGQVYLDENAPSGDLTELWAVREWLQKQATVTTAQDPLVESLISRASMMLQQRLGRQFTPTSETKLVAYAGGGAVNAVDLRAVNGVIYDAQGTSPVTLTSTQWRLRPASAPDGVYFGLHLPDYASDRRWACSADMVVSIDGEWGFAHVPADVEHGCIVTVATWLREGAAFNPDGNVVSFERRGKVPQDVLDGLSHYRLPVV